MYELEYPFDGKILMRKRKAYKRELLEDGAKRIRKKVAVLGGSTTNDVIDILELFLLNYGIEPLFYQSEYGRFWEEGVFDNQRLDNFAPDIIYVHTTNRNIKAYPAPQDDETAVKNMLKEQYDYFEMLWVSLSDRYHCPVIQNNFELPDVRVMGNMEAYSAGGSIAYITNLNMLFHEYAKTHENFYINDINYQSACFGLDKWHDSFYWYMYKYALNTEAIPMLAFNVANIIKSVYGKNKKAIALDLDNTLWGGIVGEDGVENLSIGNETSKGQIYVEFQQYLKKLQSCGVLLNIISKNEEQNARAGLEHPEMVLRPGDFISIKANWEPKSENLLAMSEELNLGADAFVFVDDNPAERDIVRKQIPGAGVPEPEKAEALIKAIDRAGYFEMTSLSAEDIKRSRMYHENAQRARLKSSFANYSEYLLSLGMTAEIQPFTPVYNERIAQLTNKSNQFNLTTKRYTRDEIDMMSTDRDYITLYGRLEDKFGDNGVVTVVIGKRDGDVLDIILWLMSCRVLKRDMEAAMMDELVRRCEITGIKSIRGYYYPTDRNRMVRDFYEKQGYTRISKDMNGNTVWIMDIKGYINKNHVIKVKEI